MAFVLVFAAVGAVTLALVGVTYAAMHKVVRDEAALDPELRGREAVTGLCAACDGAGTRIEPGLGTSGRRVRCWRCDGSGEPPPLDRFQLPDP
jgi:hypothetical protein